MTRTINGKEFTYSKITLGKSQEVSSFFNRQAKIAQKRAEKKVWKVLLPAYQFSLEIKDRLLWRKICRMVFVKGFLWKYFRLQPRQLKYKNITLNDAGGIQADFFGQFKDEVKKHSELLVSLLGLNQNNTQ